MDTPRTVLRSDLEAARSMLDTARYSELSNSCTMGNWAISGQMDADMALVRKLEARVAEIEAALEQEAA